jgi:hypothetical protein
MAEMLPDYDAAFSRRHHEMVLSVALVHFLDGERDGPDPKLLCGDRLATDRIRASGHQHPV